MSGTSSKSNTKSPHKTTTKKKHSGNAVGWTPNRIAPKLFNGGMPMKQKSMVLLVVVVLLPRKRERRLRRERKSNSRPPHNYFIPYPEIRRLPRCYPFVFWSCVHSRVTPPPPPPLLGFRHFNIHLPLRQSNMLIPYGSIAVGQHFTYHQAGRRRRNHHPPRYCT